MSAVEPCELCGTTEYKRLNWDHCHKDGDRIRGRICSRCNNLLPALEDDQWVIKAKDYLANPPRDGSYYEERKRYKAKAVRKLRLGPAGARHKQRELVRAQTSEYKLYKVAYDRNRRNLIKKGLWEFRNGE